MTRLLHVSDIHLEGGFAGVAMRRFLNKRLIGWMNLRLRRAKYYRGAVGKMVALEKLMEEIGADVVLCSGDYTALGTEKEIAFARAAVEPLTKAPGGFVTVPGNHDVYLADAVGVFEREFEAFLSSDLPEYCTDRMWPLVRLIGDDIAVVCVDSARPNPPVFRSSGRVPEAQLEGLRKALSDARVRDRFVFVMTHYAPRLSSGRPDTPAHGLENADALLAACDGIARGAIIHGHVHKRFTVKVPECSIPLFGAGSTTQAAHEGLWVYDVDGGSARATPGTFAEDRYVLDESASVDMA